VYLPKSEDEVVRSNNHINSSVQCRRMASNSNTNEKTEHKWQSGILGISWKDRVTNEEVRVRTGQHSMDEILSEKRLRWLGHVIRMDHQRNGSTYLDGCTGRFQGLRKVQVVCEQTDRAQSTRTC